MSKVFRYVVKDVKLDDLPEAMGKLLNDIFLNRYKDEQ
jgi:hypothetical protein